MLLIAALCLYGFTHVLCSLYRTFGPNGEVKRRLSAFASDYKALPGIFKP